MYGDEKNYTLLVGNPKKRHHFEDISAEGRIILKQIYVRWDGVGLVYLAEATDK
jgi:hypothetical protein